MLNSESKNCYQKQAKGQSTKTRDPRQTIQRANPKSESEKQENNKSYTGIQSEERSVVFRRNNTSRLTAAKARAYKLN